MTKTAVCDCGKSTSNTKPFFEWFKLGLHLFKGHKIQYRNEKQLDEY